MINKIISFVLLLLSAAGADDYSYTYSLRIDASVPHAYDFPIIDECIGWPSEDNMPYSMKDSESNGENFTWYGMSIQLPEDASTGGGMVASAMMDSGFVQRYIDAPQTILTYNITTGEAQPAIRIHFNDRLFWDTLKFDFGDVPSPDAVDAPDRSNYQEIIIQVGGVVTCITNYNNTITGYISPVTPTLNISLTRFGGDMNASPQPPVSSSAMTAHHRDLTQFVLLASLLAVPWAIFV